MATHDEADTARRQHADELARGGAHAIGVEKGEMFGRPGWVVVAYTEADATPDLPRALTVEHRGTTVEVPLVVERAEPFEAQ